MATQVSQINLGWTHLLHNHGYLDAIKRDGYARITSKEMNTLWTTVDARLMSKFDSLESRPEIFRTLGLSLWPEGNGKFVLLQSEDPYIKIDAKRIAKLPERFLNARDLGFDLKTLHADSISTESQALAILQYSNIMHTIHSAPTDRLALTDGGRARLQDKTFTVQFNTPKGGIAIPCYGVQMEPDAVHESDHMVTVTESKVIRKRDGFATITSLHARQIAFPHEQIMANIQAQGSDKHVESGALYAWKKPEGPWQFLWLPVDIVQGTTTQFTVAWNRAARFTLVDYDRELYNKHCTASRRKNLAAVAKGRPKTTAAFPQFNRFNILEHMAYDLGRIGASNLIDNVPVGTLRKWKKGESIDLSDAQKAKIEAVHVTELLQKFDYGYQWGTRNINYLVNAMTWLGLVEEYDNVTHSIKPSALCLMLASVEPDVRTQRFWNLLMSSPVMKAIATNQPITMADRAADGLENDATFQRRLSTAKSWVTDVHARMQTTPHLQYALA